ncbi:DUF6233 domain-containing protein [Streptomyces sp. NBC_00467]|uniref:DUF6233 domain-containing protein n=1 Tax=Streptomyces sp. NBC_00467 TaxID=2975752 RepID=UPI003FA7CCD8
MYVHAGPCNTRLRTRQVITAQEARRLITDGVRACILCRPRHPTRHHRLASPRWAVDVRRPDREGVSDIVDHAPPVRGPSTR